jgi:hypothetical protein
MATILVAAVVLVGAGYVLWAYEYNQPPFCAGYPPGGNCPGNVSYTFRVSVNYSGPWQVTYYGYHGVGALCNPHVVTVNYTGGNFRGTGSFEKSITLLGLNFEGVSLYVKAQKLDSSSSLMILGVGSSSDNTVLPYGQTSLCLGAVP